MRERITRKLVNDGPPSQWRYRDLLPVPVDAEPVDLGAGFGHLRRSHRLAEELGLRRLYILDDTRNPTSSFKDRPTSVAATVARHLGLAGFACVSTGNLAGSVAAHGAAAGLPTSVVVPAAIEPEKVLQALAYGARLVRIDGTYDDANRTAAELSFELDLGFANINLRPFYAEGSKTLAFEAAESLGWNAPDHVVHPMGAGASLVAVHKGYQELVEVGLLDRAEVLVSGAQASGCAPIAEAVRSGQPVRPVQRPQTICASLAIGDPADGNAAAHVIASTGGRATAATDAEIVEAIRLLGRTEGIFTEPAGGATLAGLRALVSEGFVRPDESVVLHITGSGLKTPTVLTSAAAFPEPIPARPQALAAQLGVLLSSA